MQGAVVLLAAGRSKRFGSDKRFADFGAQPLLTATCEKYTGLVSKVVVVVRPNDVVQALLPSQCDLVEARDADLGMAHSLVCGVKHALNAAWVLIALADMPWIEEHTIRKVGNVLKANPNSIVRPSHGGQPGHPVGFSRSFFVELTQLKGDRGAHQVIERYCDRVIDLEVEDEGVLRDIDRPEQLTG